MFQACVVGLQICTSAYLQIVSTVSLI